MIVDRIENVPDNMPYRTYYTMYYNMYKNILKSLYVKYKKLLKELNSLYTEQEIYNAIESIKLAGSTIIAPTINKEGKIIRHLEYGTGRDKAYKLLTQTTKQMLSKGVGKNDYII